jgi:hypothetical protein
MGNRSNFPYENGEATINEQKQYIIFRCLEFITTALYYGGPQV